uniref:Putative LOC101896122 [Musca domestica] n=1 Tax=Lepeophtheirus salmonis TaxID=72036 RepID=A0A0K2TNR7_LEPSM
MRYWLCKNPQVLLDTSLHREKVTVSCGLHAGGIIDGDNCHVTVNENRYRTMVIDFFLGPHCKEWAWQTFGFNKTVPLVRQKTLQSILFYRLKQNYNVR